MAVKTKAGEKGSLSKQYGGVHAGGWVDLFPKAWIPYIQLCRLSPPAGLLLIFFPHLFGAIHAGTTHHLPINEVARVSVLLLGGSFLVNNAGHAWNDLVDADIDAKIARTRTRPIPRGAVSKTAAFLFTVSQAIGALMFLLPLPMDAGIAALASSLATVYYPFAKRHFPAPQLILGFCLTWGIMVGSAGVGVPAPWTDPSTVYLFIASALWVIIYDTIYAHQDLADDLKIGVKSTAVMFGEWARPALWLLWASMSASFVASGLYGELGLGYYAVSVPGAVLSIGVMVAKVDLKDPASCWAWFSQGIVTGAVIASGLLGEYLLRSLSLEYPNFEFVAQAQMLWNAVREQGPDFVRS
ncbi:UbiA prenyltransferase family-domain-containing protein [Cladorrhinum sp. PSN332]|nr:UbiA prenyltransferase family-domain-containing protein [Cladorrhinum sp. PSN332]